MSQKNGHITETAKNARPQWSSYTEFLLSCIGYTVGLGNIWRFPYLAYINGGGAFLIPYWCSVFLTGLPFYFMELSLGQYSSLGPNCIFGNMAPIFRGVGWAMVVISFMVIIHYNIIVAWVLVYLVDSFRSQLRWSTCTNNFNTVEITFWLTFVAACHSNLEDRRCQTELNDTYARFYAKQCWNNTAAAIYGINESIAKMQRVSPSEEYFNRFVLRASDSFDDTGSMSWRLVLSLTVAWLLVFACLFAGTQSSGKAVYVTATLPYVVLFILLIRGATLPGAANGLLFYVVPNFSKLKQIKVWVDAAVQVFYSLGPAFGGLITIGSYNPFKNNSCRDAIIVSLVDSFTSMFAGCAIFSIIGYMAYDLGVPVSNVTQSGIALAFIAYPEAIVRMPISPLWSMLFFVMLISLGLGSEFAMLETCTTALLDQFPKLRPCKTFIIGAACIACFIIGLIMCTQAGVYYFIIFNDYSSGYCLILVALFECVIVSYVYGIKNFSKDIGAMIGFEPNQYFQFCWCFVSPAFMVVSLTFLMRKVPKFVHTIYAITGCKLEDYAITYITANKFILAFTFLGYEKSSYGKVILSGNAEAFGWILSILSLLCLPGFALYQILKTRRSKQPWSRLFKPTADYCPAELRYNLHEKMEVPKILQAWPEKRTNGTVI